MTDIDKKNRSRDSMYLLSFLDAADRLNILLLEVRHLQQSIINSLRAPTLYLPLRHEELYIFGGWEEQRIEDKDLINESVAVIAKEAILRYPSPRKAVQHWSEDKGEGSVESRLLNRIGEIWTGDMWVRGERQHYHALRALQILKQQIFRDKVQIFREAKNSRLLNQGYGGAGGLEKPAFLILRRGVHYKIQRYIQSLRTHQQNFGKSLDFGLQRYPRPSIDRRREIGIFNDFLSNRTVDLRADTLCLLAKLTGESEETLLPNSPTLLHGWSPLMHVRNSQLWDNVGRELDGSNDPTYVTPSTQDISYIDTSFWSPDRPDLQPLVGKEIAYAVMRNITQGFSDDYFSNHFEKNNHITPLWVSLSKVIHDETYDVTSLEVIHENSDKLLREIITDCIAVSIKGLSYLYALFLSTIGTGLESLLKVDRIIRLDAAKELTGGVGAYSDHYEWYFRLKITAFWLKNISDFDHLEISDLDNIVFEGVDTVCEELLTFLDDNNISAARDPVGDKWRRLCEKLEEKLSNDSLKVVNVTKKWREKRSKDTWDEDSCESGDKCYHRSTMRLDVRLQNFLFRELIQQKKKKSKALYLNGLSGKELFKDFCSAYGLKLNKVDVPHMGYCCQQPKNIFRQLHDIPFQSALLRSIDLLGRRDTEWHEMPDWSDFVKQSHENMSLGRELFSFALEFYTWGRESPKSRLLLSINILSFMQPSLELLLEINCLPDSDCKKMSELALRIKKWLFGKAYDLDKNEVKKNLAKQANALVRVIKESDYESILDQYAEGEKGGLNEDEIKKLAAIQIDDAFANKTVVTKDKRRLEQLSGYKVKELKRIFDDYVTEIIDKDEEHKKNLVEDLIANGIDNTPAKKLVDSLCLLGNLKEFLHIRDDSKNNPASEGRFYKLLLQAFGGLDCSKSSIEQELPNIIKPVMVSRLAVSSPYTVANPKQFSSENDSNLNALGLAELLQRDDWLDKPSKDVLAYYAVTLGRYDIVSFTNTKLPCLCQVSRFKQKENEQDKPSDSIEKESFATHFARREVAFPLKLYNDCEFSSDQHELFAISSISLQRRSMRLNLIYRLLNARKTDEEGSNHQFVKSGLEAKLNKLIKEFGNLGSNSLVIKALLTDGWGDLLLIFMCRKGVEKGSLHENIMDFQQALYEDFMVDRTELIYTPQCLDHMNYSAGYKFNFAFRFQEDRKLERCIQNFVDALIAKEESFPLPVKWEEGKNNYESGFEIAFTTGQNDVRVSIHVDSSENVEDIYKKLLSWFAKKEIEGDKNNIYNEWYDDGLAFIDKIETTIERIQ